MSKKIALGLLVATVGMFSLAQVALAASATLLAAPSLLNTVIDKNFTITAQLQPADSKVCVVKGVLAFNNLSCQSITVAEGIMAQTAPTCANPAFVVGIPGCTTATKNILTVSAKGSSVGQAAVSFSQVKVIGAGVDVPFTTQGGLYNIAPAVIQKITPVGTGENLFDIFAQATAKKRYNNPLFYDIFIALAVICLVALFMAIMHWVKKRNMRARLYRKDDSQVSAGGNPPL